MAVPGVLACRAWRRLSATTRVRRAVSPARKAQFVASTGKKMQHKAKETAGKAKESGGKATGRDDVRAKGAVEQRVARVKQAVHRSEEAAADRVKPKHSG